MGPDRSPKEVDSIRSTYDRYDRDGRERLWDRSNRGFDRLKNEAETAIVGLLRASLVDGGTVLDVGCGSGDLAVVARGAAVTASWVGIDLLPDRIATAARRVPDGTWIVGSATELPFEDRSFDVAVAVTVFSSLPTYDFEVAVAAEITRVLRPRGWLVWHDLRYDNPSNHAVHGITGERIRRLFPGWSQELRSFTLAPPIARRLGPLTPVAYPLLQAIPPLRSHLIGRLRCPS